MPRVLVMNHYREDAAATAERIRRHGLDAEVYSALGTRGFPSIRANPPDAIVLDLTRMPSWARAIGALLREGKGTRMIPLVFIQGDPEKTRRARELLPDAVFTTSAKLGEAIGRAIRNQPADPMKPRPSQKALLSKLCVKEGTALAVLNAPEGFFDKLGPLPEAASIAPEPSQASVILLFVRSVAFLGRNLPRWARELRRGQTLWLIWPKTSSKSRTDLTMPRIVALCSSLNLAGYKVCAVDEVWSGLAVTLPRRPKY